MAFATTVVVMNPEPLSNRRLESSPRASRIRAGFHLRWSSSTRSRAVWLLPLLTACAAAPRPSASTPAATAVAATGSPGAAGSASGISRTLLEQADLPDFPGWETRLFLIEYAPGVAAPKHHHPVGGVGYVFSGSFESAFEGEAPKLVREGQSFRDLAQTSHVLFRNVDDSKPLKFVIMYVVRKGEPVLVTP